MDPNNFTQPTIMDAVTQDNQEVVTPDETVVTAGDDIATENQDSEVANPDGDGTDDIGAVETTEQTDENPDELSDKDLELGYMPVTRFQAKVRKEQAIRQKLNDAGWTFDAQGMPVAPAPDWKPQGTQSETVEIILEEPEPVIPIGDREDVKQVLQAVRTTNPGEMSEMDAWRNAAKNAYEGISDDELDRWTYDRWKDLKDRWITEFEDTDKAQRTHSVTARESTAKINSYYTELKNDPIASQVPEVFNTLKDLISKAEKEQGVSRSDIAENLDEFKALALGKHAMKIMEVAANSARSQTKTEAQKEAERVAANRKRVGGNGNGSAPAGGGSSRYSPEVISNANKAGMTPQEYAEYSRSDFQFSV